mgnify:CR=1 FL=1
MNKNILSHSREHTLDEWLSYLESLHSSEIDLGLARIGTVAKRLAINFSFADVITVAGTNGKGTTCAFIEQGLLSKNNTVAVYSSPHIERFNERLRINKVDIDDQSIINAFKKIEQTRQEISLTYYEYTTLAAFLVLMDKRPDYIILEVGLGGRLDATNIIDADIGVVTTVDLDHQAFLGNDRETIGREKAGILRGNQLAVLGEISPPASVIAYAQDIAANIIQREKSYFVQKNQNNTWQWHNSQYTFSDLPLPHIPLDNAATAIQVLSGLLTTLSNEDVVNIIEKTKVAGRTEHFRSACDVVLDVGHNPLASRYLAQYIQNKPYTKVYAVVGMLSDKDSTSTLAELANSVDEWHLASLAVPRGNNAAELAKSLLGVSDKVNCFDKVEDAYKMALSKVKPTDLILVFGSFFTVAAIRKLLV